MRCLYPERAGKRGWMKDFRKALMQQLINKYRAFTLVHSLDRGRQFYKTHTLVMCERAIKCYECGKETKIICQECSMLMDKAVGVCRMNDEACFRYHICTGNGWKIL